MTEVLTSSERKSIDQFFSLKSAFNEAINLVFKIEVKGEKIKKPKPVICILGNNRIYFFKHGGKIDFDVHFVDIVELKADNDTELSLKLRNDSVYTLVFDSEESADDAIRGIHFLWTSDFPAIKLRVVPESRLLALGVEGPEVGACGGFPITYLAYCDYMNLMPLEEVIWQMENYVMEHKVTSFDFSLFGKREALTGAAIKPIMAALTINAYFQELQIRDLKLSGDGFIAISSVLATNTHIRKLVLSNVGLNREGCEKIVDGLNNNAGSPIQELDLSGNSIEDKGFVAIADYLRRNINGLTSLNLADCGSGKNGSLAVVDALAQNERMAATLSYLNISSNKLDLESSIALGNFLAKTTHLTHLLVANSSPTYSQLKKCQSLHTLDSSNNKISKRDSIHLDFVRFLSQSPNLKELNISKTHLPEEILHDLYTGLANLETLDISDNDIPDKSMISLLEFLIQHKFLRHVNLSNNFIKGKPQYRNSALDGLIALLEKQEPPLLSLTMQATPKTQMKTDLLPVILCLIGERTKLAKLDVTGHGLGEAGAIALCKVVQTNNTLRELLWDDNHTTALGFQQFVIGLSRNTTLLNHFVPVCDIAQVMRDDHSSSQLQRMHEFVTLMQDKIVANNRQHKAQAHGDRKLSRAITTPSFLVKSPSIRSDTTSGDSTHSPSPRSPQAESPLAERDKQAAV